MPSRPHGGAPPKGDATPCGPTHYAGCACWEAQRNAELASLAARVRALEQTLVRAAIPLETLYATEIDGLALCQDVKNDIAEAVGEIRAVLTVADLRRAAAVMESNP